MPDRYWNALYFAAYRCQATRSLVVLSSALSRDRDKVQAAYDAWLANGQDPRVRLRFDDGKAILEYDDAAA
jgi:hypothetical protein